MSRHEARSQTVVVPSFTLTAAQATALDKACSYYNPQHWKLSVPEKMMTLLSLAMINPKALAATAAAIVDYAESEGMDSSDVVNARINEVSRTKMEVA
jgi:hypothetical protein